MGRNHTPNCHTKSWTGASEYKVYDPFCPVCQEDRHRSQAWMVLIVFFVMFLALLGICCGICLLLKGIT